MEENIFTAPDDAAMKGNKLFENILDYCFEKGNLDDNYKTSKYIERILKLSNSKIVDADLYDALERSRKQRNKVMHRISDEYSVLKFNKLLFRSLALIYKRFEDDGFEIPQYVYPEPEVKKNTKTEEMDSPIDTIDLTRLSKMNGSYLINELSKLSILSKDSIGDSDGLDDFKNYMHIERDIQNEFYEVLNKVKDSDSNNLILLAGSVGDGKSHLLAHMSSKYPEIMKKFMVYNDASISKDPDLTAIDMLMDVLKPFNDVNIKTSKNKAILAINLGIIRGLLDDDKFNQDFKILKDALDESNVFNSNFTDAGANNADFLDIINFSDNHLYELKEDGVESKFLRELFSKIASNSPNNPFYLAYLEDKKNNINNPIILNYEMFLNEEVRENIIQILLKYIITRKKLLSTREIINFIYEILVPPFFNKNQDMSNLTDYIDDLMPILLFNTVDRSKILREIAEDSPLNIRNEFLDGFLISLNTLEINSFVNKYFNESDEIEFLKEYLLGLDYPNLSVDDKQDIKDKLIFFALFFGNDDVKDSFNDEIYADFIKFLYLYNYKPRLNSLFNNLKKSIFKWKGSIKKNYILIDELDNYKVGKQFNPEFKPIKSNISQENKNRFKTDITFNFLANGEYDCEEKCRDGCDLNNCVKLDIDYFLFESIKKISDGYQPNKSERQYLMVFNDFINELIQKNKNKQILIKDDEKDDYFKFNLSSGQYYSFERE